MATEEHRKVEERVRMRARVREQQEVAKEKCNSVKPYDSFQTKKFSLLSWKQYSEKRQSGLSSFEVSKS